jgi:multidrug efflux pump subunit AcrA (membrane-fusion protein)
MKKIIWVAIVCIVLLALVFGYNYISSQDSWKSESSSMSMEEKYQKTYEHTFPEQVTKSDFFAWTFIQNDVAWIYPRREALVKDILVDIGDSVVEGQTLAILFEPWVSGQAGSNIGLKSTMLHSSSRILVDTKKVAAAKISEFDSKITEKETLLLETLNTYDVKISQVQNNYDTKTESLENTLELEQKVLTSLEVSLENSRNTKDEKLEESNNNIIQKETLLDFKVDEIYTLIMPLVYVGEEDYVDYENIRKWDLSQLFSARDSNVKNTLVFEIQKFQDERYTLWTLEKYELLSSINRLLVLGLENTTYSVGDTDETTVRTYITQAKNYNTALINQKEVYDDALNALKVLKLSETEKISGVEQKIEEQKTKIQRVESDSALFVTDNSVKLTESEKELQVEKLSAELDTLRKSKDLLVANENKQITSASNSVAIARADLNKEYVASWDYKIISPFSWTISKRDLEIGAMISPKGEAFRIAWVDNSLSRITKKEIKFYVPENLQDQIEMWQEVYFSASDEAKSFTGTIYRISPEIDPTTRAITVQAKVDDSLSLSNKSSLRVTFKSETLTYRIPTSSIYNKDERKIVYYKKDNGKLGVQDITIISDDGEFSLISWDFDTGLKVVTTPIFVK